MRGRHRIPSKTLPRSPDSGKSTSVSSVDGSPGGIYQPGWGVTNSCRLDTPEACQDMVDHTVPLGYFSELHHLPNTEFLGQYNMNLARQVARGSQLRLRFEQEVRLLKEARAKIARRDQRIQVREEEIKKLDEKIKYLRTVETEVHGLRNRTQNLETLLEAEVDMKKVAEAKNVDLAKVLESLRAQFSDLQVNNNQLSQQVTDIQEKDKNRSQNDKTEHENGKTVRSQKDKVKVNKSQSQSQPRDEALERASKTEPENLNCQKWAHPYPPSGLGQSLGNDYVDTIKGCDGFKEAQVRIEGQD
ncbi:hypothetical protein Tco_1227408 [Tanacetum coccineum]